MSFFLFSCPCSIFVLHTVIWQASNFSCRMERTGKAEGSQRKKRMRGYISVALYVFLVYQYSVSIGYSLYSLSVDDAQPQAKLHFQGSLGVPYLCTWCSVLQVFVNVYTLYIQTSCFNLLVSNLGSHNLHFPTECFKGL